MNILYLLIGVSLLAALVFLALFIWAVKTGQYDDLKTPSMRVLFDEEREANDNENGEKDNIGQTNNKRSINEST